MKLLLDENLSRRIVPKRSEIWQYAKGNGYVIVSRDSDFRERSLIAGHPPQVIWLKIPNRSKTVVLNILLADRAQQRNGTEGGGVCEARCECLPEGLD